LKATTTPRRHRFCGPTGKAVSAACLAVITSLAAACPAPSQKTGYPVAAGRPGEETAPSRFYPPPPQRFSTTLTIDGEPARVDLFGRSYRGVRITMVGARGLGATAGLAVGDVLLSLNGQEVDSAEGVDALLNRTPSGDLNVVAARRFDDGLRLVENRIRYRNPLTEYAGADGSRLAVEAADCQRIEQETLALMNADRARQSPPAPPLQPSRTLQRIARDYAADMVRRGFFSHTDPDGRDVTWRLAPAHVESGYAENLFEGTGQAAAVERYFLSEPAGVPGNHRDNILNPGFAWVGVGCATRADGSMVVVEEFSRDRPAEQASR